MKFNESFEKIIKTDLEARNTPMLYGSPGIGKTSFVSHVAHEMLHTEIFVVQCNQLSGKDDLTGLRTVPVDDTEKEYKQIFFPMDAIAEAVKYANEHKDETPILDMEEINRAPVDVTSACLSMQTTRRMGSVKLPDNLLIICTGNQKGNVNTLDTASTSRFVTYTMEPDVDTYIKVNPDLNKYIKAVLEKNPDLIFCQPKNTNNLVASVDKDDDEDSSVNVEIPDDDLGDEDSAAAQFTTPRTLTNLSNAMNRWDDSDLIDMFTDSYSNSDNVDTNMLTEVVHAHIGDTDFAAKLLAYINDNVVSKPINVATQQVNVIEPPVMGTLMSLQTTDEIQNQIAIMDETTKLDLLSYMLTKNYVNKYPNTRDRRRQIIEAAGSLISATPELTQRLLSYKNGGALDIDGVNTLKNAPNLTDDLNIMLFAI